MMKKFKKQMKNEKGLTLIELLAVIVILAIVAAIAVPAIGNIIQNSKEKAVIADAQMVLSAANLYFVENPEATTATVDGDTNNMIPDFLDDAGTLSDVKVNKAPGDDGNTITFTGKAGDKVGTFTNQTKKMLNDTDYKFEKPTN